MKRIRARVCRKNKEKPVKVVHESWKREGGDQEESNYVVFFPLIIIPFPTMKMSSWDVEEKSFDWEAIHVAISERLKTRSIWM